eukprot:1622088-Rhodomonas_salina.3
MLLQYGRDVAHRCLRTNPGLPYWPSVCCYVMCRTGLAYAATPYAVCGTDIGYGATTHRSESNAECLRSSCYPPTHMLCNVRTQRMRVEAVWGYARCGTDIRILSYRQTEIGCNGQ